ncbi:hypothetical protein WAB17_05000 [Parerythrobacter aurantius]|uniref:hypothetical protein n=1 Tax=Parerythrobacter aurantius TaxID=3127706 RepID=UPI0032560707
MKGYMFQSKTGALFFVAVTMFGVASLVGTGKEDGALTAATKQIQQQGVQFRAEADGVANPAPPSPQAAPSAPADKPTGFTPPQDLVLDPAGLDPAGIDPTPKGGDAEEIKPDVVLVESSSEIITE